MTRDDILHGIQQAIADEDAPRRWHFMQLLREWMEANEKPPNLYQAMAELTDRSYGAVAGDLYRARQNGRGTEGGATVAPSATHEPPLSHEREFVSTDDRRRVLRRYLHTTYDAEPYFYREPMPTRVVVAAGDFHSKPDPRIVAEMVHTNADIYVLGGDLLDNSFASRHGITTRRDLTRNRAAEARDELAEMRALLETLLEETRGELRVMTGNHDVWPAKTAAEVLPEWLLAFYRDPLEVLLHGLGPRVTEVSQQWQYRFPDGSIDDQVPGSEYAYVLGDILFSHMNFTSTKTQRAVWRLWRDWFKDWRDVLGLESIRVICHFHVHSRTLISAGNGYVTLIEPGMAGLPRAESYKFGYQAKWRPSVQGFLRCIQYQDGHEWKTDIGSIELVAPRVVRRPGRKIA